jgi:hypothetical protein
MRSAGNRRGPVHLGHLLASDEVIPVESPEWFCRHARIETAHENFEGACSYYRRAFDLINAARLRIDEGKSRHGDIRSWGWWSSNSHDAARDLLGLVRHVIQYYNRLMRDKNEHLRAVAEDYGLPVEVAGKALERAAAELTARQAGNSARDVERVYRLQAQYEERLATLELPAGGFSTPEEAGAGSRLAGTLRELQKLQTKLGLPVTDTRDEVLRAASLASAYWQRHDKETGAFIPPHPRGRPRRKASAEGELSLA